MQQIANTPGMGNFDPFYQQRMALDAQVTARNSQGQNATPEQMAEMRRLSELSENDPGVNARRDALNKEAMERGIFYTQGAGTPGITPGQIANTPGMGMAGIGMNFPGLDGTRIPGEGPGLFGNTTGIAGLAGKGIKAVSKAGKTIEDVTTNALKSLSRGTNSKIAKAIIEKGIPKFAGSAVEGAAFGAGQLISEEALGNLDFNAEGVAATVLPTAILSGAIGGIVAPTIGAGLKAVRNTFGGTASANAREIYKQLTDPVEAALDSVGMTPAKKTTLKANSPEVAENAPIFLKDKVGFKYSDTAEELAGKLTKTKDEVAQELDNIYTQLDNVSIIDNVKVDRQSLYNRIANQLEEKYIKYKKIINYLRKS
jgi:hypothetical protein